MDIKSVQFVTDDDETITVFIQEALADIDDENVVHMQLPVFASERSGHIYLTSQECNALVRTPIIREALRWAVMTRLNNYKPRR